MAHRDRPEAEARPQATGCEIAQRRAADGPAGIVDAVAGQESGGLGARQGHELAGLAGSRQSRRGRTAGVAGLCPRLLSCRVLAPGRRGAGGPLFRPGGRIALARALPCAAAARRSRCAAARCGRCRTARSARRGRCGAIRPPRLASSRAAPAPGGSTAASRGRASTPARAASSSAPAADGSGRLLLAAAAGACGAWRWLQVEVRRRDGAEDEAAGVTEGHEHAEGDEPAGVDHGLTSGALDRRCGGHRRNLQRSRSRVESQPLIFPFRGDVAWFPSSPVFRPRPW